jgi:hypothetical protein
MDAISSEGRFERVRANCAERYCTSEHRSRSVASLQGMVHRDHLLEGALNDECVAAWESRIGWPWHKWDDGVLGRGQGPRWSGRGGLTSLSKWQMHREKDVYCGNCRAPELALGFASWVAWLNILPKKASIRAQAWFALPHAIVDAPWEGCQHRPEEASPAIWFAHLETAFCWEARANPACLLLLLTSISIPLLVTMTKCRALYLYTDNLLQVFYYAVM